MIKSKKVICKKIKGLALTTEKDIKLLSVTPCIYARSKVLYELSNRIQEINGLCNQLIEYLNKDEIIDGEREIQVNENQRNISTEELSKFTGKDGNPAYVAVNGTVYDVTNNAAWAAATHFGLTAGKDLTGAFASCHGGQTILSKLVIVGKLI